jgi:hypothetical protein
MDRDRDAFLADPEAVDVPVGKALSEPYLVSQRGLTADVAALRDLPARAMTEQNAIYRRWQTFFERYDVLLTPAITISPRSWRELYPAQIDGAPTRSYFHWLALAYATACRSGCKSSARGAAMREYCGWGIAGGGGTGGPEGLMQGRRVRSRISRR